MSRNIGPKTRLSRRFGEDLGLKTNAAVTAKRLEKAPGQHGSKMRRKLSQYGLQLKEKQKLRAIYGISEKQLVKLYKDATKAKTNTGMTLLSYLERRLDNVIYRLGWAPTRAAARQLVNHGHFLIGGMRQDIPSYQVVIGDIITLKPRSSKVAVLTDAIKNSEAESPWLSRQAAAAKVTALPKREEINENIQEQLIVEFYSR